MSTMRSVHIEALGICEHCGVLFTIEDLPAEALSAQWNCSKCNGVLTTKSLGYVDGDRKVWVGKDGKWTETKPTENFVLRNWLVVAKYIRPMY